MMEKTKDVILSEQIFRDYSSGSRQTWKKLAIQDREVKINAWKKEHQKILEARGQMAIPVNEILPSIDLIIAELTENPPRFSATGTEKSDFKTSSNVAKLFDWIWYQSKGESKIDKFTRDFIEIGLSGIQVYFDPNADYGKGEILFTDLDPIKELYLDPSSKEQDGTDGENILVSKVLSINKLKVIYPTTDFSQAEKESPETFSIHGADNTGQILNPTTTSGDYCRVIDRYTKIKIQRYHVKDLTSNYENVFEDEIKLNEWLAEPAAILTKAGREQYVTDPVALQKLNEIVSQYGMVFHLIIDPNNPSAPPIMVSGLESEPYAVPGETTVVSMVTKGELVKNGVITVKQPLIDRIQRVLSVGGIEIANEVLPIRDYPIITCMLHHDRTPYPMGDIRITTPLQQQLDKLSNLMMTYLSNITNLKLIMQKDSASKTLVEEALQQAGVSVIEVDFENGDTAPFALQYPPMPNAAFAEKQNIIRQIQRIIGSYSFQDGEVTSAPRTLGGTQQIDQMMQRRASYKQRKIEASINQMAKVISQLIPNVYTTEKEIRIIKPNYKQASQITFNEPTLDEQNGDIILLNNITNMEYDVRVIAGSMLPTNRQQNLQTLTAAYQNGIIKNASPIIEQLPIDNVDEVLQDEDTIKNAENAIMQLQQQNEKLQGLIETLQRENIQKEQKVSEMKTKTDLQALVNDLKSTVNLTKMRMNDLVKNTNKKVNKNGNN